MTWRQNDTHQTPWVTIIDWLNNTRVLNQHLSGYGFLLSSSFLSTFLSTVENRNAYTDILCDDDVLCWLLCYSWCFRYFFLFLYNEADMYDNSLFQRVFFFGSETQMFRSAHMRKILMVLILVPFPLILFCTHSYVYRMFI